MTLIIIIELYLICLVHICLSSLSSLLYGWAWWGSRSSLPDAFFMVFFHGMGL